KQLQKLKREKGKQPLRRGGLTAPRHLPWLRGGMMLVLQANGRFCSLKAQANISCTRALTKMLFAEIIKARTQTLAPIAKGSCQPSKARMTEGLKSNSGT
ncbi:MAG: hypothetical protein IKX16_05670, partial [Clostridia bacterium]|nr:hypothetical protein [Clostridia bacterium]